MSIQPFAFALADALMGAGPGQPPYKGVAFLLGKVGHERSGVHRAADLHTRTRKFADRVRAKLRRDKGLQYDPLDVVEFNSFDQFIARKPRGEAPWNDVMIVTHGGGEAPTGFSPLIAFGTEIFLVDGSGGDLLAAMQAKRTRVDAFRKGFHEATQITLMACSGPPSGSDVAVYMRELFGTRGLVRFPVKNVDFDKDGRLGTAVDPEDPRVTLRQLAPDEWRITPAKDDILGPPPPPPPGAMNIDDFFRD